MRVIRFLENSLPVLAAVTEEDSVYPLPFAGFLELVNQAEAKQTTPLRLILNSIEKAAPLPRDLESLQLITPLDAPEVWAAGVTYERSKEARNYEATGGKMDQTTFYDKVYDAVRPEIFFKSTARRTVGPNQPVYLRGDSNWQIPEPELGLVLNHKGEILGYTIGNDMSCRDIEGENPLYLPQAKIWRHSCSLGPAVLLAEAVEDPYRMEITCRIYRNGQKVVEGSANTSQLKRKFAELVDYLKRDNEIFDGTVLLTGTSIVPPDDFTLADGDRIEIEISGIGVLSNLVKRPAG
ncbi:fumarylacetoacetate hydrolase family protein [Thermoactinomyces sp. CICC 10521]|uniref:fumarylacetoacetate hydrolase family protein n=1 Tax=Thermoactinomyces sp. CICC 10521 TaxID=2767426 RepID=UPI0018DCDEC9|nr:fumarylacetoacetate hydrolase family protein [Thermoactinomyces sp. CICC 10521]MBH8607644.1 fumarylacetoacetate hydrolase family protein [Thermoactinomyces sp. CICC 10521]